MELAFGLDRVLISPILLVTTEETAKESKPQGGASRQRDASRKDRPKSPGTSTTPIRPSPGGVQDSEMVRAGVAGFRGLESLPGEVWAPPPPTPVPFQGPCRRHLDSVLQQLQTEVFRGGAQGIYVPNCDLRGFYRKQQVRRPGREKEKLPSCRKKKKKTQKGYWMCWGMLGR